MITITSFSPFGYEGALVTVEVDLRRGIPAVDLVGLADNAVKEARERMRAAIRNGGYEFPSERVLISLSPADVKKEGAGFDLAIALAVLDAKNFSSGKKKTENPLKKEESAKNRILVMGELELSGKVRGVRGVHAAVLTAIEAGIDCCIIPKENALETSEIDNVIAYPVSNLTEAVTALEEVSKNKQNSDETKIIRETPCAIENKNQKNNFKGEHSLFSTKCPNMGISVNFPVVTAETEYSFVQGQKNLVRGLQIAAAGGHNLMVAGPPGCGKTLALQKFPGLLPLLEIPQAREVTRIYSIGGFLTQDSTLLKIPPFRMPHQSASLEGMIGGGSNCRPGEISLAHNGVLFLDEAAEFRTSVLQSLRVPLENRRITLSRAGRHTIFPADFQLLLATNPCPCGNFGARDKVCVCSIHAIEQYWKKFSAPLLDRIDIRIIAKNEKESNISCSKSNISQSTAELRSKIKTAIEVQRKRQNGKNANLTPEEINYFCKLDSSCTEFLEVATNKYGFTSRGVHSIIRISRTIADMEESFNIRITDIKEAIELRKYEGGVEGLFS